MGLDFVEFIMEVEERFGISVTSEEIGKIRSVGDLISVIRSRISGAQSAICPCLTQFHRLRRFARETMDNPRLRIRPTTSLQAVLSIEERRQLWDRLPEILGYTPPSLTISRQLRRVFVRLVIFSMTSSLAYALRTDLHLLSFAVLFNIFLVLALLKISDSIGSVPPTEWETYGDITRQLVRTVAASKNLDLNTDDRILDQLKIVLSDYVLGDPNTIDSNSLLIEDLGIS